MATGFRFGRSQGMEGSTGNLREFAIDPTNTNPIFTGDVVNVSVGGYIEEASGAADNDNFVVAGVFWGCRYTRADGSYEWNNQWDGAAGRTGVIAHVILPSGATLIVQGDPTGGYTQADIGTRKGLIYNAGNPATGASGVTLGAAGASVATAPFTVLQQVDIPETDPSITWFEVTVNRQSLTASGE